MKAISKKISMLIGILALSAFIGVSVPDVAEAGFNIKVPGIKIKTGGGQTNGTIGVNPQGNTISGRLLYNNTNNNLPADGFDVYLVDGDFAFSNSCYKEDGDVLIIFAKGVKLATSDANGYYSAPMPADANAYATKKGKYPEVQLVFYKPNVGFMKATRSLKYLGEFLETKNISATNRAWKTTSIVFEPKE